MGKSKNWPEAAALFNQTVHSSRDQRVMDHMVRMGKVVKSARLMMRGDFESAVERLICRLMSGSNNVLQKKRGILEKVRKIMTDNGFYPHFTYIFLHYLDISTAFQKTTRGFLLQMPLVLERLLQEYLSV